MAEPRLVATDLDGTLLRSDGTVSRRTAAALHQARERGLQVVVLTARPPRWITAVANDGGLVGLAVCCNGAIVYDLDERRVAARHELAAEKASRLVEGLRSAVPGVVFACEREALAVREPGYVPLWDTPDEHPRTDALQSRATRWRS